MTETAENQAVADVGDGGDETVPTRVDVATAPSATTQPATTQPASLDRDAVLRDYELGWVSRHTSLIGRREVLTGKAKFGIFGDGKEVPQLAMARAFRDGDVRSGYYRDQTFMLAAGMTTVEELFAQLYADPDLEREPASGGRQMNAHFASRFLDAEGRFRDLTAAPQTSADVSPTGSQMPRLVGLAQASTLYRHVPELAGAEGFSRGGGEVAWGTIGNASCAEGMFWESVNAVGVLQAPMLLSIWDDEYGISVSNAHQITKRDLSAVLSGFQREGGSPGGFEIRRVRGWDYPALVALYGELRELVGREHVPAIVHVVELTQPQGHSTSGSQERYKSPARLDWERQHDCLAKMRAWILAEDLAGEEELAEIEQRAVETARQGQRAAWEAFVGPIRAELDDLAGLVERLAAASRAGDALRDVVQRLRRQPAPLRRHLMAAAYEALIITRGDDSPPRRELVAWRRALDEENETRYGAHLLSESPRAALRVAAVPPRYADDAETLNGFEVLNRAFDAMLARDPRVVAFGEDVGQLGDVNQGMAGLQEKHGALRVADTGIRETTILGQAIGLAMRGLRPIAEIQYLDYILYALQILSDDLATVRYRTRGGQMAPVIVRTRGHRLEGIWHSGSPMAGVISLVRGVHVCVPRDMTRAAGFYNTLLAGDDPGIVVEVLNGYRQKERLPENLSQIQLPLGVPEVLRQGDDVTVVTYGACCRIAAEASETLAELGVDVEIVDVQTLLPFDREGVIGRSLQKTNRILFLDEDVPGGTSAYMLQQVLETQGGYHWLDAAPRTLAARAHRPAFGSDGDYWSKPQVEDVVTAVYELMHESDPKRFPLFDR